VRQSRPGELGRVDRGLDLAGRRGGRGDAGGAFPPDGLLGVATALCGAIVVAIAGALVLVLGAGAADRALT
jgi:hypothetical protein